MNNIEILIKGQSGAGRMKIAYGVAGYLATMGFKINVDDLTDEGERKDISSMSPENREDLTVVIKSQSLSRILL